MYSVVYAYVVCVCVCVCVCVYVCVCMCMCLCMCPDSFADQISTRNRSWSSMIVFWIYKVRGDEIEELHNRLKISIDRRSFKFRHPRSVKYHPNDIRSLMECAYRLIHPDENSQFHSSLTQVRIKYYIHIIYHNIRLGRLNSIYY